MSNLQERFEKHIYYSIDGCWYWTSSISPEGYGRISVNGVNKRASRVSYELHKGDFDHSLMVCHTCDNRSCVNPDHLFLGSAKDNYDDMVRKDRWDRARGADHGKSRLTIPEVLAIREMNGKFDLFKIAENFNVSHGCVYAVIKRITWRHV